jgi:hypothetical protein
MAKRFGGFTPQQQQTLLSKMGYTGQRNRMTLISS